MTQPDKTTVGRFWFDDNERRLWLQEYADDVIVSFIDGYYEPEIGEGLRPERKLIVAGDTEHGLRLLAEPIRETLKREREEQAA
jgi:hypothetical protein